MKDLQTAEAVQITEEIEFCSREIRRIFEKKHIGSFMIL
jgi:hypothetical protein